MTLPAILFALLIALFYGALYHLVRGGGFWRLVLFLFLGVLGFTLGHLVGLWRGWVWIPLGSINLGVSTVGSFVLLLLGDWLTGFETGQQSKV
ncbi:MAG: hypothetical protein ACM3PS_09180 [Syntrophothermus sp.]